MKKKSSHRLLWYLCFSTLLTCFILSISILSFSYFFNITYGAVVENGARKHNKVIREITLTITEQTTLQDIASILLDNDFIGSKLLFSLHGRLYDDTPFNTGQYTINSSMSNTMILDLLTASQEDQVASIKLTIPEGYTILQIANKLDDLEIVSTEDFLSAANERTYDYDFLRNLPDNLPYPLEGYLFPDTYFINPHASAEEIIIKMLNRFQEVTSKYTQNLYDSPYTLHDVITISSIIEEEAKLSEERPTISGVIYNRLNTQMKLQMCSTVQYGLGNRKTTLTLDDLTLESPYNTYLYKGLPISPICSPGEESIKAAFMPEQHDYYYFVLNNLEKGSHSFSRTSDEHTRFKAKYNQLMDQNFMD